MRWTNLIYLGFLATFTQLSASDCTDATKALALKQAEAQAEATLAKVEAVQKEQIQKLQKVAASCSSETESVCAKKLVQAALSDEQSNKYLDAIEANPKLRTCALKKQKDSKIAFEKNFNIAANLGIGLGIMIGFHEWEKKKALEEGREAPQFNWAMLINGLAITLYRSIIQCQNVLTESTLTPREQNVQAFTRYLNLAFLGNASFIGFLAGQDAVNGKNPFEAENLERYYHDFVFGVTWDLAFGVFHVVSFDKFLLTQVPQYRKDLARLVRRGVIQVVQPTNGPSKRLILRVKNASEVPSFLMDFLIRSGYAAGRSTGYLASRSEYLNWILE